MIIILERPKFKKTKRLRLIGLKPPQTNASKYNPIFGQFYQKLIVPGDKMVHKSIKYQGQRPHFKVQKYHPKIEQPVNMVSKGFHQYLWIYKFGLSSIAKGIFIN